MKTRILTSLVFLSLMMMTASCLQEEERKPHPIPKTTTDTPSAATYSGQHLMAISYPAEDFISFGYSNERQFASYSNVRLPNGWVYSMQCSPLAVRIDIEQEGEAFNTTGFYRADNFVFDLFGHVLSMKYSSDVSENDKETGLSINRLTESFDCSYEYDTDGRMISSVLKIKGEKVSSGTQLPPYEYTRTVIFNWKGGNIESVEAVNDRGSSLDTESYKTEFKYTNAPNMGNIWAYTLFRYNVLDYIYPSSKLLEPVYMMGYFGKFSDKHPLNAHYEHKYKLGGDEEKIDSFDQNFSFEYNSSSLIGKEYNVNEGEYYLYNYSF